jgi:hypothetical protein
MWPPATQIFRSQFFGGGKAEMSLSSIALPFSWLDVYVTFCGEAVTARRIR